MSIKKFLYWVIFFTGTIAGVIYGWPGETPTYRVPIWLPEAPTDPSLAAKWLQNPGWNPQLPDFKAKKFSTSWSFTTPLSLVAAGPEGEPQTLIHLGKDGMDNIFYAAKEIGGWTGLMPWPESWLRPILVAKADIEPAGFLVIKTRQDLLYWVKSGLIAMILSLCLIWFLYEKMGTASRFIVQWPLARQAPPPSPETETKPETAPIPKESTTTGKAKRKAGAEQG